MSFTDVNNGIQSFFKTEWEASYNTPIAYQNIDYDSDSIEEWVRLVVFWEDQTQSSRGADCQYHRFYGSVMVQIFTPVNQGMNRGLDLAHKVVDILSSRSIQGAVLETAGALVTGQTNNWNQLNVNCDFHYDLQLSPR